jgi:tetratricopeptide (TPR) repeat protein
MRGMKYNILMTLIVLLPFQIVGQVVDDGLLRARALFSKGDYQSVIDMPLNSQVGEHGMAVFYLTKGRAAFELGQYDESVNFLNKAGELEPGIETLDLARAYRKTGDMDKMYSNLEKHLTSDYKLPRKEIMLDPVFANLDRDRSWIRFWSQGWYNETDDMIAEASYRVSREDTDFGFWSELMKNTRDNPDIMALIAQYYGIVGDRKKAEQFFHRAMESAPENRSVKLKYGNFLAESGEYQQAANIYSTLIVQEPYEIKYHLLHVMAILKAGEPERALGEIRQLQDIGIASSELNVMMAREILKEDPALSVQYLDPVIESDPSTEAFNLRAQAKKQLGNLMSAIDDYAMSLDINPKQPDVYFQRGHIRLATGDRRGACYDWEHALNLGHRDAADMLYKYCR